MTQKYSRRKSKV